MKRLFRYFAGPPVAMLVAFAIGTTWVEFRADVINWTADQRVLGMEATFKRPNAKHRNEPLPVHREKRAGLRAHRRSGFR